MCEGDGARARSSHVQVFARVGTSRRVVARRDARVEGDDDVRDDDADDADALDDGGASARARETSGTGCGNDRGSDACVGMTRATPSSDDDGERDGFGRDAGVWARARFVTRDAKTRLALPGNGSPQVGERPFSDQVFGFAFCVVTFLALGRVDDFFVSVRGVPFMISSWASLAVLAFKTVGWPLVRWPAGRSSRATRAASTAIALACVGAFGTGSHVARAMALSVSLTVMMRLGAIHPPAGAVAVAPWTALMSNRSGCGTYCFRRWRDRCSSCACPRRVN